MTQRTRQAGITRRTLLGCLWTIGLGWLAPVFLKERGFLPLSNGKLNRSILSHTALLRRLVEREPEGTRGGWIKCRENPVLGGKLGTCFDACVLREGDRYRMWFSWRPERSIGLTESRDGIVWSEPKIVLQPVPEREMMVNRPGVIRTLRGYEMWYTGQDRDHSWIGHAVSGDGAWMERTSRRPVFVPELPWEKDAVMAPHVIYDEQHGQYRMWYSAGEQYEPNAIGYAVSADGQRWSRMQQPIFTAGPRGSFDQDRVAGASVIRHESWHIMFYIGFRDITDAAIGIARSRDGITAWERHSANPIIAPGGHFTDWDYEAVYKPSAIPENRRWVLWYNGRRETTEQIGMAIHPGTDLGF